MISMKSVAASLALIAAAGAVTGWVAWSKARSAEAAHPPEGRFVEVEGQRIHAVVKGAGPDLVLIHGANGSVRDWTFSMVDRLAENYRVIALDRPGLGWSESAADTLFAAKAESPADQAAVLAQAARALGAERPIVLGHSFGGAVALAWGLEHDPAALVLVAGVALPWPGGLGWVYEVNGTSLGGAFVPPLLAAWAPRARVRDAIDGVFAPGPVPEGYADHIALPMVMRPRAFRSNARQVNGLYPHIVEMSARYDRLTLPIEIVHGDADTSVPVSIHSAPFADRVPSANLTVLDGIGHMPHHHAPDEIAAAIHRAAGRAGLR